MACFMRFPFIFSERSKRLGRYGSPERPRPARFGSITNCYPRGQDRLDVIPGFPSGGATIGFRLPHSSLARDAVILFSASHQHRSLAASRPAYQPVPTSCRRDLNQSGSLLLADFLSRGAGFSACPSLVSVLLRGLR